MVLSDQCLDHMTADRTSPACDEHPHIKTVTPATAIGREMYQTRRRPLMPHWERLGLRMTSAVVEAGPPSLQGGGELATERDGSLVEANAIQVSVSSLQTPSAPVYWGAKISTSTR
jgi:hypothetical protein